MSCHEDQISTNAKTDTTSVDMIRLTKYGFRRSFIRTAAFLSWLGIVSSVLGILGGVSVVVVGISGIKDPGSRSLLDEYPRRYIAYSILMAIGSFIILSSFIFVLMWIHLKRRTSERKISGIEETVKIFNHFIAVLEIIVDTILIIFFIISLATIETASPGPRGVLWIVISLADTGTAVTLRQVLQLLPSLHEILQKFTSKICREAVAMFTKNVNSSVLLLEMMLLILATDVVPRLALKENKFGKLSVIRDDVNGLLDMARTTFREYVEKLENEISLLRQERFYNCLISLGLITFQTKIK